MARKWTQAQRRAHSKRMKIYWARVKRIAKFEDLSIDESQRLYRQGMFRGGEIQQAVEERLAEQFRTKLVRGKTILEKYNRDRHEWERSTPTELKKSGSMATYRVMIRRLSEWTGLSTLEIREYLRDYPQWRDGVSPLFNGEY